MAETVVTVQKGTYGIVFTLNTGINLTGTTSMILKIRKSSNTIISKDLDATNIVNADDGIVTYIVEEGDLDESGSYSLQIIDNSLGKFVPSTPVKFKVKENIF